VSAALLEGDLACQAEDGDGWVLVHVPRHLAYVRLRDRISGPGLWELMPYGKARNGVSYPGDYPQFQGARDVFPVLLAAWVRRQVGGPVILEPSQVRIRPHFRFTWWHTVPAYRVRRAP
jgi:hypothetical protein